MRYPTRNDHVFATAIDDQLLLHDPRSQQTHCLNPLARRVWELCDGARDRDAIVDALAAEPGRAMRAEDVVDAALDSFAEHGLLAAAPMLDRRALGGRIAKAVAAGLVISVLAPGRAAHASTVDCAAFSDESHCTAYLDCIWLIDRCEPAAG